MLRFFFIFLSALVLGPALCRLGVDIPNPLVINATLWSCLKTRKVEFLTARAYRSYGAVDPNVLANIKNAHAAGIKQVDVYIFPCVQCGNPRRQVNDTLAHLKGADFGVVWVDVEEYKWNKDKAVNRAFLTEMFAEVVRHGRKLGVYTNWREWDLVVGRDWDGAAQYLLWYPYWNRDPSFKDFKPFGGWKKPYRKQLTMDTMYCGEKFLLDYQEQ